MEYPEHEHIDREHLHGLDSLELKYVRRRLYEDIDHITHQLEMADAKVALLTVPLDTVWRAKALHARRCKETDIRFIDEILLNRSKKAEALARQTYAATFINVARRRLPPLLLEEIDLQAREEMTRPGADKEYDERLKRRRQLHEATQEKAELVALRREMKEVEFKDDRSSDQLLKTAEEVCRAAQEIIRLWSTDEPIDVFFYDVLSGALDDWGFQQLEGPERI